eukprot:gene39590-48913_t
MSFLSASSAEKSTILITGGATGIGLALAQRFLSLGHVVIAAGRRQEVLDKAAKETPGLKVIQGDVGSDETRIALFQKVIKEFPDVNVLINNAGAPAMFPPLKDTSAADWKNHTDMLNINLNGPIHLSILFTPHFITKQNALIANVTGMLAFFPMAAVATGSVSRAGLHSFTISLRHQLKDTSVKVVEIIPPPVNSGIAGSEIGMDLDVYSDDVVEKLLADVPEIGYEGDKYIRGSRQDLDDMFNAFNQKK